jgi:hypothetical protein
VVEGAAEGAVVEEAAEVAVAAEGAGDKRKEL